MTIRPSSPFHASDTPSRQNTLMQLYGARGRMPTTIKPEPSTKQKHWTEVPKRVEEMHDVARGLIKEYGLSKPQGAEWTPEDFIIDMKIDTSAEYANVRGRIHHAVKQAWINDLTAILVENGVTDPTEQALAFKPYDTLEEAVNSTSVNIKAIRMQVCGFSTSHFLKEADASMHKEQPTMDTTNLADVFDPAKTDEEVKAALKAAELDLTGSPDVDNAPNVANVPTEKKAVDPIGELKLKLFNLLATQFTNDTDAQIIERMKVALKADNFQDFIIKHNPIEKAAKIGVEMVDEYLEANQPQPATEPPAEAQKPQSKPVAGDPFQPATDDGVFLKMAIAGPSGSGKSFTSLKIAREMFPDGKVAFLCTEHKAARRYAKHFQFNLMEIADYHPQKFIDAIHAAERYGYDVLIIDSLSHEWSGTGGLLSLVDGKFGGWKEATPLHQKLIETIQEANIHIIATMRSKMEYSQEKDERTGKTVVRKLGMAPIQREQTEYEFDVYAEIEMGSELTIAKSRCFQLKAGKTFLEGNGLAPVLKQWIAA